jgi:hypothetical protein
MKAGGAGAEKVLSEAIRLDQLQGAILSLDRGANAAFALREQVQEDERALAREINVPEAIENVVYCRKMSQDMRCLLERRVAQSATSNETSRL